MRTAILAATLAALLPLTDTANVRAQWLPPPSPPLPGGDVSAYAGPAGGAFAFLAPANVWSPGYFLPLQSFAVYRIRCTSNTLATVQGQIGYVGTDGQWHVEAFQALPIEIHTGNMMGLPGVVNVMGLGAPSGGDVFYHLALSSW